MRLRFLGLPADLLDDNYSIKLVFKLVLFFIVALIILILLDKYRFIFKYIDKYRYIIGLGIVILCTVLELSGSSIGAYFTLLGHQYSSTNDLLSQGTLLGIPRNIRTDEFSILTPFNLSQEFNDYRATTNIIRGSATDVTTFYAAPCFSVATLFRPFLWGYIALGGAKGLAFYWSSRTVCLLLVSYEFCKLITKRKKILSFAFAAIITFSQTIQWWYSTNGLIEMFIFGELAIVLLYYLFHTDKLWKKALICLGLVGCAGGYALAYYPAQQIPLAYIFGAIALFIIIDNRKLIKAKDVLLLNAGVLIFAGLFAITLYNSWDTILATMNTVYPGKRINTGGDGSFIQLFYYILNIFTPIDNNGLVLSTSNVSESAVFYSMFPIGILCAVYSMVRKRKIDLLYIFLIIIEIIFIVFCFIGFPELIAKITLLSYSFYSRILSVLGYIDIIIIFRFFSEDRVKEAKSDKPLTVFLKIIIPTIAVTIILQLLYKYGMRTSLTIWITAGLIIIFVSYLILRNTTIHKEKLAIALTCIISLTGLCINPLQHGTDVLYEDQTIEQINNITQSDSNSSWIVVSDYAQINNIPIIVGAKTINTTNTYPNMNLWKQIDPYETYKDIYNRYANIMIDITNDDTSFELNAPDNIQVNINANDLNKLNVSYILCNKPLDQYGFNLVSTANNYYIYSIR